MSTIEAIIESLQRYDPSDTVEGLLQKPEFQQELSKSFKSLSTTSRAAAFKIVRNRRSSPPKQSSRQNKALKAILKVDEIALPSRVLQRFNECQQQPSKFWTWAGIPLDLQADAAKPFDLFFCEAYLGITRLEAQREWDTIVWRFFVIFFHDLVNSLSRTVLTPKLQDYLVSILSSSSSIEDTTTIIRRNLSRWVSAGCKYSALSDSLDNGAPFLLPHSVTDKTWEMGLPLDGPIHATAVEHLKSKQLCEVSKRIGADILGTDVRAAILQSFKWQSVEYNTGPRTSHAVGVPTIQQHGNLGIDAGSATEQSPLRASTASSKGDSPGRASIALLCQAATQATRSDQVSGQRQFNQPNTTSMSSQGRFDGGQQCAGFIGTTISNSVQSIQSQTSQGAAYQSLTEFSHSICDATVDVPRQDPELIWNTSVDALPPNQNPSWTPTVNARHPLQNLAWTNHGNLAWATGIDALPPNQNLSWATGFDALPPTYTS